ncbi:MAG: protein translocase subunit SecD [Alphaproteobacteria bacterium]|nr:protein translocase subunit SecD [Alphaproteobacteria bacterium]
MLDFPRWKIVTIVMACLFFIMLASPNFISAEKRVSLPDWYPERTVNLGLDLQGGSHLLLRVDFDAYLKEHMDNIVDAVRLAFRKDGVKYRGLANRDGKVVFSLREGSTDISMGSMVRDIDDGLAVLDENANEYTIGYSEQGLQRLKKQVMEKSMEIISRRVDETGTREPMIQQQGDDRILLQVPGLEDPEMLKDLLGKTAKMTFHLVDLSATQDEIARGRVGAGVMVLPSAEKDNLGRPIKYAVKRRALLSGEMLVDAAPTRDEYGKPAVNFRFNPLGARKFGEITTQNVGAPFAVVLDGEVITAPRINEPIIGGSGIINGQFTEAEANQLAILLRSGSLPAPLAVMEERSVGPSLGADSIAAGKFASAVAIGLVFAFMLITYGLFGIFSNIALFMNIIMILAFLSLFQATLTLPGIAGIVLVIGMAVDANVLIFERIREEVERGKTPFAAVDNGFKIAFRTILDSNITTLIAAIILFYFGTGTVKGFAVTLSIGILSSMFSATVLTRLMVATWMRRNRPKTLPL